MKSHKPEPKITWVSANTLIEQQTKEIERVFRCSNPKPRARAMGFQREPVRKISQLF